MKIDHRVVASALIGFLVGASTMQAVTSRDRLAIVQRTQQWETQANRWQKESQRLREELNSINLKSQTGTYIQSIKLEVLSSAPVSKIAVQAAMEPYTEALLGLPLQDLRIVMVYHMLNDRLLTIGGALYVVQVKALLISPTTSILVVVKPKPIPRNT